MSKIRNTEIAIQLLKIFDSWNLTSEEKSAILDLPPEIDVVHYLTEECWDQNIAMTNRIQDLLVINKILHSLFPENPELANAWVKTKNKAFSVKSPLETISKKGLLGINRIRAYLDSNLA